jgi:hypothetical protein
MKAIRTLFPTFLALAILTAGAWAQTEVASAVKSEVASNESPAKGSPVAKPAPVPITAADIQELKDALAAQQQEILALQEQLKRKDQALQQVQTTASDASAKADTAQARTSQLSTEVASLKIVNSSPSGNLTASGAPAKGLGISAQDLAQASTPDQSETYNKQMEGQLTIHFRGINITPGGYAAAEFVRRSRGLGADVSTPFNSVTLPGAAQSRLSEFFASGRQSKISTYVDGRVGNVLLSSYVSADFLSAGVTSTPTSTNSYTLRLRQAWGQVKFDNGWSFLGGQSWSLLTENGSGISPDDDLGHTNDARPKTIDSSYNVGFVYSRQAGIRLTKAFGDKFAIAVALENPQATVTTHGNASNFFLGETGASNSYNTTTNYSFNPAPDLIVKAAFDPGFGHYEVFGLLDRFTDRVYPCVEFSAGSPLCTATGATSATGAFNASKEGGGIGASARWNFAKRVTFGLKGFGGDGIGRYGPGGLPDATIYADGSVHLVKNLLGLGTLEWHSKKLDLYSYGGVEYAARAYDFDSISGKFVGYGSPTFVSTGCYNETAPGAGGFVPGTLANCTGDTRALVEGTLGFWYKFYTGPKGSFRFGTQYSYVSRQTWSGIGPAGAGQPGVTPSGIDNMVFTSFRYYLP